MNLEDETPRRKRPGYRNPPDASKFKPGKSGNPKGRPRKPKTANQQLDSVLSERVLVTIDGRRLKLTRQEIMLRSIANKAIKGDLPAVNFLLNLKERFRDSEAVGIDPKDLAFEDREIMRDFLRRSEPGRSGSVDGDADILEAPAGANPDGRDG